MNPKVPSLVGFAAKNAAEKDSSVKLAFRINCKDNKFTDITPIIINSILDDFIYPEIFQRAKHGMTISNFKIEKAHIIMHNETQVTSDKTTGAEKAKCAEVAANIAIDVIKIEDEGIRAIMEIISKNNTNKRQRDLENLGRSSQFKNYDESNNIKKEYDPNRKF